MQPHAKNQPCEMRVRVIQADDGWRWTMRAWIGNVDTKNDPPTTILEARRGYKAWGLAYRAGLNAAQEIV